MADSLTYVASGKTVVLQDEGDLTNNTSSSPDQSEQVIADSSDLLHRLSDIVEALDHLSGSRQHQTAALINPETGDYTK